MNGFYVNPLNGQEFLIHALLVSDETKNRQSALRKVTSTIGVTFLIHAIMNRKPHSLCPQSYSINTMNSTNPINYIFLTPET